MKSPATALQDLSSLWAPPPRLTVSEWADTYRKLSSESSAEAGQYKTSRVEYARGMMDAIAQHETVVLMTSAQVTKTTIIENMIGYHIHLDPCPMLFINPTLEMSETFSKDRLAPMLRDCECFKGLVAPTRSRDKNSTILHKVFRGGHLTMAGANSPASLASRPVRVVLFDEVDRFALSAGMEGDPVKLAMRRATRFWNRKFLLASTPTVKGKSRIEKLWNLSDKRKFFVPCPHCHEPQVLKFEQIKFKADQLKPIEEQAATAFYECEHCQGQIFDKHKPEMISQGQWRATAEGTTAGFHIWEAYFPQTPWSKIIAEFLEAKDDPELFKTFINTVLGELWEEQETETLDWEKLFNRAERYEPLTVPHPATLLTAGVDVQGDRLECSVWAWGDQEQGWLIYHAVFWGDPTEDGVWVDLDLFLQSKFTHESGVELGITATAIDTGYKHQDVYNFVRRRPGRGLYCTKGSSKPTAPVIDKPTSQEVNWRGKPLRRPIRLWPVGTEICKVTIHARLNLPKVGRGYLHFPVGIEPEYYEQLCAERREKKLIKGFEKWEWVKVRKRNEALDCLVYAYAIAELIGLKRMNWSEYRKKVIIAPQRQEAGASSPEPPTDERINPTQKPKRKRRRRNFFTS